MNSSAKAHISKELPSELCSRYNHLDLLAQLQDVADTVPTLSIGLLGEFNSGKTALANAMIGTSMLPMGIRPTTAALTFVEVVKGLAEPVRLVSDGGEPRQASVLEFEDAVLGRSALRPILRVPPGEMLRPEFHLVDTPGLASLEKMHTATTLGYFPELDVGLLCLDCAAGNLPASVDAFLRRPDVAPILPNLVVVLTHCDLRPQAAVEKVRAEVREDLRRLMNREEWEQIPEIRRVVATSARLAIEEKRQSGIDELQAVLSDFIWPAQVRLCENRRSLARNDLSRVLLHRLKDQLEAFQLDDEGIARKAREVEQSLDEARHALTVEETRLGSLEQGIRMDLQALAVQFATSFAETDKDGAEEQSRALGVTATETIRRRVESFYSDIKTTQLGPLGADILASLQRITRIRNFAVTTTTAIAVAAISGGTGLAANAGEAGIGAAIDAGARSAARGAATAAARSGAFAKLLGYVGKVIKEVNPAEFIGDLVADAVREKKASRELHELMARMARSVAQQIRDEVVVLKLEPLERELQARQKMLDSVSREKIEATDRILERRNKLEQDVVILGAALEAGSGA